MEMFISKIIEQILFWAVVIALIIWGSGDSEKDK